MTCFLRFGCNWYSSNVNDVQAFMLFDLIERHCGYYKDIQILRFNYLWTKKTEGCVGFVKMLSVL